MSYGNLICSPDGLYQNGTYEQYYKAYTTFNKLSNAYVINNCLNNNSAPFSIPLVATDYKIGVTPINITTNCSQLEGNLITFGNSINARSSHWIDQIKNDSSSYGNIASSLQTNYQNLLNTRKQMDENVQKIIGQDNSPLYEKQSILDSAVYTTLLWTVLATSILYYAFTKL